MSTDTAIWFVRGLPRALPGMVLAVLLFCQPAPLHAQSKADTPPPESAPGSASTTQAAASASPAAEQQPASAAVPDKAPVPDMLMVKSVISTALQFLQPRTLEAHSYRDFTFGAGKPFSA